MLDSAVQQTDISLFYSDMREGGEGITPPGLGLGPGELTRFDGLSFLPL